MAGHKRGHMNKPIPFKDLGDKSEDDRITEIGNKVTKEWLIVGFVTDAEEGKAACYIRKLQEQFPGIQLLHQGPGPVAETVFVRVGPPPM